MRRSRFSVPFTFAACLTVCNTAVGEVISNTRISFSSTNLPGANYGVSVIQTSPSDTTSIFFIYSGTTLAAVSWTVDDESDWYLASPGDTLSAATIAANQFRVIFTTDNPRSPVAIPLGTFYLGVNT